MTKYLILLSVFLGACAATSAPVGENAKKTDGQGSVIVLGKGHSRVGMAITSSQGHQCAIMGEGAVSLNANPGKFSVFVKHPGEFGAAEMRLTIEANKNYYIFSDQIFLGGMLGGAIGGLIQSAVDAKAESPENSGGGYTLVNLTDKESVKINPEALSNTKICGKT